ncbi:DoxX family protein [Campylobacter sp. 19-13652]|uniref:DoxX family protein n=1 Tax=Campylobacter sp. 19-13652 TaxID=2840180 RepID=UPI001C767C38|nr:DoxX family protein [Campylobacter sp. 19-13652]BCX79799.1 hypothetical protein LBC_12610 [Campylobacter sp. 19-13652]
MNNINLSLLFSRLGFGLCLLTHGYFLLFRGLGSGFSSSADLAFQILYFSAYFTQLLCPVLIIFGIFTRISSATIFAYFTLKIYIHNPKFWLLSNSGGFVLEVDFLYIILSLALIFGGSGKYALRAD